jgi:hypothetical protein
MARFDRAIKTAERLIERNGQSVIWRTVNDGTPSDPLKPWKPSDQADVDRTAFICFLPVDKEAKQLFRFLRGTNDLPTGNIQGLMKGNVNFEPNLKDVVLRDGEILRIRSIDLLSPNGQKVLYTIEFET